MLKTFQSTPLFRLSHCLFVELQTMAIPNLRLENYINHLTSKVFVTADFVWSNLSAFEMLAIVAICVD